MAFIPDDHAMNIAAMGGAAAGALANRSNDTVLRKIAEGIVGAATGIFCGPAIADVAGARGENLRIAIAFGIGICGIIIATAVLDGVKGFNFKQWVGRFINSKMPPTSS